MHTHLTQISDEYAQMELKEIRLLKAGEHYKEDPIVKGLRFSLALARTTRHWLRIRKTRLKTLLRSDRSRGSNP
jgi:hypothetical protein